METVKAIVFESKTGFTKKYAELLSQELSIPCYERKIASGFLKEKDEIVYFGWLCANIIKGFDKIENVYNTKVLCGIGMSMPSEKMEETLKDRYKDKQAKVFYLQGGFDIDKLKGMNKFFMKLFSKALVKKEKKNEEEQIMSDTIRKGGDFVNRENLEPIIQYLNKKN